jgi:hypothetical protein
VCVALLACGREMADSWEDEEDDWEAEADKLVSGINLNEVDESRFADEETGAVPEEWDADVPTSQARLLASHGTCTICRGFRRTVELPVSILAACR